MSKAPVIDVPAEQALSAPRPWFNEVKATVALAWPLILANLAQSAIGTTDVVMLGWLGPQALAAGSLGFNLYITLLVIGIGTVSAAAPLMAQALGRRRHSVRDVRRSVRQGLWLSTFLSVPVLVVFYHAEEVLLLIGQDRLLAAEAGRYMSTLMWSVLPALWFVVLRSFLSALERPRAAFVVTFLAVGVNAFANWVLIFGNLGMPELGVVGAGLGSTLTNIFMLAAVLGFILVDRRLKRWHLLGRIWRSDWPRLLELLRIGTPIGVIFGLEVSVFAAAVALMGLIGPDALAANAVALQIATVTFMVPFGLSQAATVRVGLAAGRGDRQSVGRAGWVALGLGTAFMTFSAAVLLSIPNVFVSLFTRDGDAASARMALLAAEYLGVAALFQIFDGAQSVGTGVLRGLKDTRVPMVFAVIGYWILGLPTGAALAFGAGWGGVGVWSGLAMGLAVVALLMLWRWSRRNRLGLIEAGAVAA